MVMSERTVCSSVAWSIHGLGLQTLSSGGYAPHCSGPIQ